MNWKFKILIYHSWESEEHKVFAEGFDSLVEAIDYYMANIKNTPHCGWDIERYL